MTFTLRLRPVKAEDVDTFFIHQQDQDATHMAAFGPKDPNDRGVFDLHWQSILNDDSVFIRTIEVDGSVAGHVLAALDGEHPELSYWIGKSYWGLGITTAALMQFLEQFQQRPLRARAVADNQPSLRLLTSAGFVEIGEERSFAPIRAEVVVEKIYQLG